MKKNIKEYKEIVEIVADIQEYLEIKVDNVEKEIKSYKDCEDYKENEYYQETVRRYELKESSLKKVIDNLEKLL